MYRRLRERAGGTLLLAACCALAACYGGDELKLAETAGTVTYQGKPVVGGSVMFMPTEGGPPSVGNTDEQGHFVLSTTGRPGAVVGPHKVSITAVKQKANVSDAKLSGMSEAELRAIQTPLIPLKYGNIQTSGLTATVSEEPDQNQLNFELE